MNPQSRIEALVAQANQSNTDISDIQQAFAASYKRGDSGARASYELALTTRLNPTKTKVI